MLAEMDHELSLEQPGDDTEALIEMPAADPRIDHLIETGQFAAGVGAGSDTERQAALTQQIDRQHLPHQLDQAAARQRCDHRTETEPPRGRCQGCQRDPGVDDLVALGTQHMVPQVESVPP